MAIQRSREHALARPTGAYKPALLSFAVSQSEVDLLLKAWEADIIRAARSVVARDLGNDAIEECAQAARLALARVANRADEVGPFYLRRVIQNAVRDEARRERRAYKGRVPLDEITLGVTTALPDENLDCATSRVTQWIATLPHRLQQVYNLLYVRGYSQRTAAAVMRISQPRVAQLHSVLLARGRAEFRLQAA